jgi:hypothetical protein
MNVKIAAQLAMIVGALWASAPGQAHAQSSNQVAAEALFREARKLLDAGQFREACEKLDASRRLDPAAGTLLNLARCRERIGQTATAWATYHDAIRASKAAGQRDREKAARERAEALEPTLARLTIVVSPEARADKVQVRRDGIALPPELWGVSVPVDPGEHSIDATAAERKPWAIKTSLQERAAATITVPALEPARSSARPEVPGVRKESNAAAPQAPSPINSSASAQGKPAAQLETTDREVNAWNAGKTIALILGGVAVAGATVGTLEWLTFQRKQYEAANACPSTGCFDAQHAIAATYRREAESARTLAIVGGAVGGASLVAAAILWFTSGSRTSQTSAITVAPLVGRSELGLNLLGAW